MSSSAGQRLSRRFSARTPNSFFVALEAQLHAVLADNTEANIGTFFDSYVCERLSAYSEDSRNALLERMPADVQELARVERDERPRIGVLELDLIDFLLHYRQNRLLSVVGNVGVGKTTFLRYVLQHLPRDCPSLQCFAPIILNCLALGTDRPSYRDLLFELSRAIRRSGNGADDYRHGARDAQTSVAEELDRELAQAPTTEVVSSDFLRFVDRLKHRAGMVEPVFVFDNLDQLDPAAVGQVCTLARAVHLSSDLCVVTSMRPPTYRTQIERDFEKGAISRFSIEVEPPDLRAVIRSRLRVALNGYGSVRMSTPTGLSLEIEDVEGSINSLSSKVLRPRTQSILLRDICGENVRRALSSFEFFLRYRSLRFQLLFATRTESSDGADELHGSWFDHLLEGLMIGDREFYDETASPITNVLVFQKGGTDNYLLLHWCLSLLSSRGRYSTVGTMLDWLRGLDYESTLGMAALEHLLKRGLIYCPTREEKLTRRSEIMLSRSGAYYLERLLRNPQYLYNAVYDVPLAHARWDDKLGDSFGVRLTSIVELLTIVCDAEGEQIARAGLDETFALEILSAISQSRMMSRKLLGCAEELVQTSKRAKSERAREAGEEHAQSLVALERKVADVERQVVLELTRHRWIPDQPVHTQIVEREIGPSQELLMRVPVCIGPALKNHVKLEVELAGAHESAPLVVFWQGADQHQKYTEIAELKPTSRKGIYAADFVISGVKRLASFPPSKVTLFSASRPVFVATLSARQLSYS